MYFNKKQYFIKLLSNVCNSCRKNDENFMFNYICLNSLNLLYITAKLLQLTIKDLEIYRCAHVE